MLKYVPEASILCQLDYFWEHFYMEIRLSRNPSACIAKQMIQGQAKSKLFPSLSFQYL